MQTSPGISHSTTQSDYEYLLRRWILISGRFLRYRRVTLAILLPLLETALLGRTGLCGHAQTGEYQDRCGYGPRLPLLVITPYAKVNFADHRLTDQTSIIRFIEDNWGLGRIGNQSFDAKAGSLMNMFDFTTGAGYSAQ